MVPVARTPGGCARRSALLLGRGAGVRLRQDGGVCREVLAIESSLWTFAGRAGVEPTNNAAERAVRHAVCWRKTSYGTDSERGSRFVERMLTVVASCRQQGRTCWTSWWRPIRPPESGALRHHFLPDGA